MYKITEKIKVNSLIILISKIQQMLIFNMHRLDRDCSIFKNCTGMLVLKKVSSCRQNPQGLK